MRPCPLEGIRMENQRAQRLAACHTPCACRQASALPAAVAAAVHAMLRCTRSVGGTAQDEAWRAASFCSESAVFSLVFLLTTPWTSAAALRAGLDQLLVEACQVRGLSVLCVAGFAAGFAAGSACPEGAAM